MKEGDRWGKDRGTSASLTKLHTEIVITLWILISCEDTRVQLYFLAFASKNTHLTNKLYHNSKSAALLGISCMSVTLILLQYLQ